MTDLYDEIMACHDSRDDVSDLTYEQGFRAAARLARTLDETRKATHDVPANGRRLENRVAALESLMENLSRDLPSRITAIEQHLSTWTEEEGSVTCPDCAGSGKGADSITENARWEAVVREMMHTYTCHEWPLDDRTERTQWLTAKATVAEAIRQGLAAMPIDPTDERLVQVTARAMQDDNQGDCACVVWPCDHAWDYMARIALMSIAAAQQEGAK